MSLICTEKVSWAGKTYLPGDEVNDDCKAATRFPEAFKAKTAKKAAAKKAAPKAD